MKSIDLIEKYRQAFGENASLPVAVIFTDEPVRLPEEKMHCIMNYLIKAKDGISTSLGTGQIFCRGGKVYTGFGEINEGICKFVSGIEKYKDKPGNVMAFVERLEIEPAPKPFVTFHRIDQINDLDDVIGVICFATPDILAGLWSWANFDINADDAVIANFGSGCSSTIANMMRENRIGGHRCFISMLDISVRPLMNPTEVCFSIPIVRLERMLQTFDSCCLAGAPAWDKVKKRNDNPNEFI